MAKINSTTDSHPPTLLKIQDFRPCFLAKTSVGSSTKFRQANLVSDTETTLKQKTSSGGVYTGLSQLATLLITTASMPVLARILTPDDFGLVAMVAAVMGFAQLFSDAGLSAATIQRQEISSQQVANLFWIACVIGGMLSLFVVIASPLVAHFYGDPRVTGVAALWSIGFIFSALSIQPLALLRREMRFGTIAAIDVLFVVVATLTTIVLAWQTKSYFSLVVGPLAGSLAKTVSAFYARRFVLLRPRRNAGTRQLIQFGANLTGFHALHYFARNADNILIGKFLGAVPLGIYSKAYALMMLPLRQLNLPLTAVAVPALCRLQDEPVRYRAAYVSMVEKLIICSTPLCLLCVFYSEAIISVLLGPQWTSAAPVLAILALNGLTQPLTNSVGWLFISQDRTDDLLRWGLFSAPVIVASFIVGLPFGLRGIAIAYTCTFALITPILLYVVSRKGPVSLEQFIFLGKVVFRYAIYNLVGLLAIRRITVDQSELVQILLATLLIGTLNFTILLSSVHGRKTIQELKAAISFAFLRRSVT